MEEAPKHLDEEGRDLWVQCEWIITGGAVSPSVSLQLQALAIRRELRMESQNNECRELLRLFHSILRHKDISPPMNFGVQEDMEKRVAKVLGI